LERAKRSGWSTAALKVIATTAPTPGMVISRRHTSSARTALSSSPCRLAYSARSAARARSNASAIVDVAATPIRALLTARKLLVAKLRDVESSLRGILRGFGLKVGAISKGKFEARIRELVAGQARLERVTPFKRSSR
jgi:hypothetical protein